MQLAAPRPQEHNSGYTKLAEKPSSSYELLPHTLLVYLWGKKQTISWER